MRTWPRRRGCARSRYCCGSLGSSAPRTPNGRRSCVSLGPIVLNDAAVRRLTHYCRRVPLTEPEFVEEDGRQVRYVGRALREVVWRDVEVRDALLAAED